MESQLEQDYKNAQIYLSTISEAGRVFREISRNRQELINGIDKSYKEAFDKAKKLVELLEDIQDLGWDLTNDIKVDLDD